MYNVCIVTNKEWQMTKETVYNIGDDVSHGIGGDRYYDGKIVRMTKRFIFTDAGRQYTRKVAKDGTVYYTQTGCKYCYLMPGKHEYMDPHF
jgi:hypothetical protein